MSHSTTRPNTDKKTRRHLIGFLTLEKLNQKKWYSIMNICSDFISCVISTSIQYLVHSVNRYVIQWIKSKCQRPNVDAKKIFFHQNLDAIHFQIKRKTLIQQQRAMYIVLYRQTCCSLSVQFFVVIITFIGKIIFGQLRSSRPGALKAIHMQSSDNYSLAKKNWKNLLQYTHYSMACIIQYVC